MDRLQQEKLNRFINDKTMADAVYKALEKAFLRHPMQEHTKRDVHTLAASRLAFDYLNEAWVELERYRSLHSEDAVPQKNIGL